MMVSLASGFVFPEFSFPLIKLGSIKFPDIFPETLALKCLDLLGLTSQTGLIYVKTFIRSVDFPTKSPSD
jgi:hypothetical protein